MTTVALPDVDLAVDRALTDIAGSFRFLLDVTPVDLVDARDEFWRTGRAPDSTAPHRQPPRSAALFLLRQPDPVPAEP